MALMISTQSQKEFGLISALLSGDSFQPSRPKNLEETGLAESLVEALVCKRLAVVGNESGRAISENICLPIAILEERLQKLRNRQILTHKGAAALNDYLYALTDQGRQFTQHLLNACAYTGAAPVPLTDYITSVDAQTITAEAPKRQQLEEAFHDISIDPVLFARLGPAVN